MKNLTNPKTMKKLLLIGLVKKAIILAVILMPNMLSAQGGRHFQRKSLFEVLPITSKDIVFLGNSITDWSEWGELLGNPHVKNRGIAGDLTQNVLDRLYQVTDGKPKKIFLLIGINDLNGDPARTDQAVRNIQTIIERIQKESPKTKLYVQSILPVGEQLRVRIPEITKANIAIKKICEDKGVTYIDLHPVFADENGRLRKEYTNDGIHIMGAGYKAWAEVLRPYVK